MSSATTNVINVLTDTFPPDRIALPGTDVYTQRIESYLSLLEGEIPSAVIFLPRNQDEVSQFVRLMGSLVEEHDAKFAIRGAGQQPLPGCANIEDGVTLDLSQLQDIEVCDGVVQIGAGYRWSAVYDRLHKDGLGVTGGRCGNNGIGGLALSGKMASRHLMAISETIHRWSFILRYSRRIYL
jgi:FAD/FMN-containing dehydrogenase